MSDKINPNDFVIAEENKDNFKEAVIERQNVSNQFTIAAVEDHKRDLEKMERELEAQISLCEATVENIYRNHEWLKDIDEEKLHHAWMLKQNIDVIENSKPKLEQVDEQIALYDELLDVVHDKFGFVRSEMAVPAVDPDDE